LNSEPLDTIGKTRVKITLTKLHGVDNVDLFVLKFFNTFEGDLILGRDFLTKGKLTLVYTPVSQGDRVNVLIYLLLFPFIEKNYNETDLEQIINNALDLGIEIIEKIKSLLTNTYKEAKEIVNDDYTVRVKLKDTLAYAFAPRRLAHVERLQLREITDTLKRGIIKPSISPYCARVVLDKKKNGQVRLCIDLRPLNSRVEKQKYPFPRRLPRS